MGRELTPAETALRDRRREGLRAFLDEKGPVLIDFAGRLGLPNASMIIEQPDIHLDAIDGFMSDQQVGEDDRIWILTRMGYYIGELLVHRLGGRWFLNEIPDSRYFLHYVVGTFGQVKNKNAMVAPFEVASAFVTQPPRRSLSALVAEVEAEIRAA